MRKDPPSDKVITWKDSVEELRKFWNNISIPMWWFENPFFNAWWNSLHVFSKQTIENYKSLFIQGNPLEKLRETFPWPFYFFWPDTYSPIATGETARRYFSWLQFPYIGWSSVISPNFLQPDTKFLLGIFGIPQLFRFDNTPSARTITKYWDYEKHKIRTSFENGEPRLLLVSVDILDATSAVTFDSYLCETLYENGKSTDSQSQHMIKYHEGVTIDHIKASMSPNLVYQYPKLEEVEEEDVDIGEGKKKYRYFWDGAYLSNTPLRELIHLHR
jgi:NTE family protein